MPRGGKRPGAGGHGPKGFDKLRAHARLQEMVWKRQDRMTEAQISAAEGVSYLMAREKKGGKFVPLTEELAKAIVAGKDKEHEAVEVWEKQPSTQAFAYLMDQTIGKAKDVQEVKLSGTLNIEQRLKTGRDRLAKVRKRG